MQSKRQLLVTHLPRNDFQIKWEKNQFKCGSRGEVLGTGAMAGKDIVDKGEHEVIANWRWGQRFVFVKVK